MALKPCRECGKDVSTAATACPHCGAAAPTREKSGDWVPCPKCGSARTQKYSHGLIGGGSFVMASCLMWIPVIGWILAPIFFLLACAFWIYALIPSGRIKFQCQACNQWFTIRKSELPTGDKTVGASGEQEVPKP